MNFSHFGFSSTVSDGKQKCNYMDDSSFMISVSFRVIMQRFIRLQCIKSHYLHRLVRHATYYTCVSGAVNKLKRSCGMCFYTETIFREKKALRNNKVKPDNTTVRMRNLFQHKLKIRINEGEANLHFSLQRQDTAASTSTLTLCFYNALRRRWGVLFNLRSLDLMRIFGDIISSYMHFPWRITSSQIATFFNPHQHSEVYWGIKLWLIAACCDQAASDERRMQRFLH